MNRVETAGLAVSFFTLLLGLYLYAERSGNSFRVFISFMVVELIHDADQNVDSGPVVLLGQIRIELFNVIG